MAAGGGGGAGALSETYASNPFDDTSTVVELSVSLVDVDHTQRHTMVYNTML